MTDAIRPAADTREPEPELRPVVMATADEVAELRADLAEFRRQVATEVRTRRLVVVDDQQAERIAAEVVSGDAVLKVQVEDTSVSLTAGWMDDGIDFAELALYGSGNYFGHLEVVRDEPGGVGNGVTYTSALDLAQPDDERGIVLDHAGLRNRAYEDRRAPDTARAARVRDVEERISRCEEQASRINAEQA